jgi:hypothetical protein
VSGRVLDAFEDRHLRAWLDRHVGPDHVLELARVLTYVRENPEALDHPDHALRLGWREILDRAEVG